ncbi:diguanylate cyclase (GGDEF) domain-containing protein [Butyrivibrio sp. ob235]|uniref:GGDEF domain-containing protein n=1 Tax=Butyrivibrio sp. ob235 TaxID=1761780 RepID=UPI0008CA3A66|nr:GGDEF domain-containing protein [Butyrivibrio sp. ob235]SEL50164.1 diguanylate cyclase (GGDEF) domain-containing protein [Butyrivibrio sp. ob235]
MDKMLARKLIISAFLFIAALFVMQFLYYAQVRLEKKNNHEKLREYIDQDLVFSWETMDDELAKINEMINNRHFSNEDLGRLYEKASLIYMQKGETMSYYRYLGYALYYLEQSEDKDYTVNIYLDLANFFLNNYTEDSARKMIAEAKKVEAFENIEDIQIKSYAYRMLGIMAILDEDYEAAENYLKESQKIVDTSHTNIYEETYSAINDTWLARVYVDTGRYEECQEKLDKWDGHDMFTTDVYRQIMLRDLIVPYYQIECYLSAAETLKDSDKLSKEELEQREVEVGEHLDQFIELCEENGYQKAELSTILRLQTDYPPTSDEVRFRLYGILNRLYTDLFDNQNISYSNVIDNMVSDSKAEMTRDEQYRRQYVKRLQIIIGSMIVVGIIILIFIILLLNSRIDALTRLFNRKTFNHDYNRAKRRNQIFSIIMIDIDDFKQINDSYGHINGDIVLGRMGQLMQREITADVHCYRYGGEEFVLLLDKKAVPYAEAVANRLRLYMEQQTWMFTEDQKITLSIGVATGSGKDDVLKNADDSLYFSKENGKNRVTVYEKNKILSH